MPAERFAALIIAVGVALRLRLYLVRPSLTIDEARVALNIATRNFSDLTLPLDHDQLVPIPYLWAERVAVQIAGVNEYALMVVPLVASILLLCLFWRVSRRVLDPPTALLATAIVALSPVLLFYATEVKPYGVDALVAVVLLGLAFDAGATGSPGAYRRLRFAGAVGVLVSIPAILLLAGLSAAVAISPGCRDRAPRLRLTAAVIPWIVLCAASYALWYRVAAGSRYMQRYWSDSFLSPWQPEFGERVHWAFTDLFWNVFCGGPTTAPTRLFAAIVLCSCAVVGIRALSRAHGTWVGVLLGGPIAIAAGASVVGRYPFSLRLVLFLVPGLVIVVVAGLAAAIASLHPPQRRIVRVAVVCGLCLPLLLRGLLFRPGAPEEIRPVVTTFLERHRSGDAIYLRSGAIPAWTFYTTEWGSPYSARMDRYARIDRSDNPAFENAQRRGRPVRPDEARDLSFLYRDWVELVGLPAGIERHSTPKLLDAEPDSGWAELEAKRIRSAARPDVWLCFSHLSHDARAEIRLVEAIESAGGRRVADWQFRGAALYHYRFR